MYPGAVVTRRWDVVPSLSFTFAGTIVFPRFHRREPSQFSFGLSLSAIPEIATEAHMAFGSIALYDRHFNSAHFLIDGLGMDLATARTIVDRHGGRIWAEAERNEDAAFYVKLAA